MSKTLVITNQSLRISEVGKDPIFISGANGNFRLTDGVFTVYDDVLEQGFVLGLYTDITNNGTPFASEEAAITYFQGFFLNAPGGGGTTDNTTNTYIPYKNVNEFDNSPFTTDGTDVTVTGDIKPVNEKIYLKGTEDTDGSIRFAVDTDTGFAVIQKRLSGLWSAATLRTGSGSVYVGIRVGIGAAGHHIITVDTDGHYHFHAHAKWDGQLSTSQAKIIDAYNFDVRRVLQPDNTGVVTKTEFGFSFPAANHALIEKAYFQTDAVVATTPVRIRVWAPTDTILTSGTLLVGKKYLISNYVAGDDFTNVGAAYNVTGVVFEATGTTPTTWTNSSGITFLSLTFDQYYPASDFSASSEQSLVTTGLLEFFRGEIYHFQINCDTLMSFKTNAANTFPWFAVDVADVNEDDMLQTTEWVTGRSFTVGQWSVQNRKIYICNTAGIQTGTFASNIALWDLLSHEGNDYWSRLGTTLSPKTAGDQISTTGNITSVSMNTGSIHYSGELNFIGVAGGTRITSDRGIYITGTIESNYELTSKRVNLTSPATIESDVIRVVNSDGHGNFYLRTGTTGIQMRNTISGAGFLWFALNDNGNVGVGKVVATEKLDVDGTVKATTFSGDLLGTINTATTGTTQSADDNSTKIATTAYVDAAVSAEDLWDRIGTTISPKTAGDDITTTGDLTAANITAGSNLGISQAGITNLVVGNTSGKSKLYFGQATNNNLVIEWTYNATPADASARITTWGYANDFYIDAKVLSLQTNNSAGQVGIGTDDPQAKLDVRGNIRVGDWTSADVSIFGAPASGGDFNIGQTSGAGKIKFVSNAGTDLVTITNAGLFGIGKYPSELLDVNGTVKATGGDITSTATTGKALSVEANTLTTGAALYVGTSSTNLDDKLVEFNASDASATGDVLAIDNNGLGQAIDITSNNTEKDTIAVTCDNLTAGDAFSINSASSSDASRNFIKIRHTGTGVNVHGININLGDSNGTMFAGSSSNTTQPGIRLDCNDLTYGAVAHFASMSADTNIRKLVHIQNANALSTGTTCLVIDQASTGKAISTGGNITAGSYDGVLNNGVTATTQTQGDNSTKVATTAYTDAKPTIYSANGELASTRHIVGEDGKSLTFEMFNPAEDDYTTKTSIIQLSDQIDLLQITGNGSGDEGAYLGIRLGQGSTNKFEFIDEKYSKGAVYNADYSSNFTDRSIVDKAYVDNIVPSGAYGSQYGQVLSIDFSQVGIITQYDKSPLVNNATGTSAGLVTSTGGAFGSGAVLNGTTDYFTLSNSTDLPTGANVRTIEAYVKIDDITLQSGVIFRYGTETGDDVFSLEQIDAALRIFTNNDSSATGNILSEGNWFLIQATYNGTQVNMWVNGEKVITNDAITVNTASGTTPYIGSRGGSSDYFEGNIDFVRVYDRVLTDTEIKVSYLRSGGDSVITSNAAKVINTSNEIHNIAGYDPAFAVDVFSLTDLPTAVTGVITLEAKMYVFHNIIVFSDRLVIPDNSTTILKNADYGFNTYLLYTGTGTFITGGANAGLRILNASIGMTGTGAKCFDVNGTVGMDFLSIICLGTSQTLGTLTGEAVDARTGDARFVARRSDFSGYDEGFTITNPQIFVINQVNFVQNASSTSSSIKIAGALSLPSTISAAGIESAASGSCFDISPIIQKQVSIKDAHNSGSGDYFTTGTTGTFTAVADASVSAEAITSVTNSSGVARFNFSAPPTLFVYQEVVISGFTTNTAYNGTYIITATGTNYFEVSSIDYGSDETGSFLSNSVTLTDTGTSLSDGDEISIDTSEGTAYDTGSYVYNKQTNSVQVNKTWTATATGTWNSGSLTQDSKYIDAHGNGTQRDSTSVASCFSSGNTSNTTTSLSSYLPLELGTASVGQSNSRFKLVNTSTGEYVYTGLNTLGCTMHATISVNKSGSSKIYDFRFFKTSGTGAAFDTVVSSRDIATRIGSITLTTSATLDPGDTFRVEIEAQETANDVLVSGFSMVVE